MPQVKSPQKPTTLNTITRHPSPVIVFIDLETAPTRGWVWRNYEDNLIATDRDWYILSFVAKFSDGQIIARKLPDYPGYDRNKECDKALVKDLWNVFNAADILVAHNGKRFDIRKANARMIAHEMMPPATYKVIDTLEVAKRYFSFGSNKLTELGRYLGLGTKIETGGSALWFACMAGDPKAWRRMMLYNKRDVLLLECVYYRLRPWMVNHPNMNLYTGGDGCPTCQSYNVHRRGSQVKLNSVRQRFQCQDCGSWFASSKAIPPLLRQAA